MFILVEFRWFLKPHIYFSKRHVGIEFLFFAIRLIFMPFPGLIKDLQNVEDGFIFRLFINGKYTDAVCLEKDDINEATQQLLFEKGWVAKIKGKRFKIKGELNGRRIQEINR